MRYDKEEVERKLADFIGLGELEEIQIRQDEALKALCDNCSNESREDASNLVREVKRLHDLIDDIFYRIRADDEALPFRGTQVLSDLEDGPRPAVLQLAFEKREVQRYKEEQTRLYADRAALQAEVKELRRERNQFEGDLLKQRQETKVLRDSMRSLHSRAATRKRRK